MVSFYLTSISLTGTDKVDRLPVTASGGGLSKLFGVPKLPSGTGLGMANTVIDCLQDWNVKDQPGKKPGDVI